MKKRSNFPHYSKRGTFFDLLLFFFNTLNSQNYTGSRRRNFSNYVKKSILRYQWYCCKKCGRFLETPEFDHIDGNRSNNHITNCQALCPNCHAKKGRRTKFF